jgi:hypothetical protein
VWRYWRSFGDRLFPPRHPAEPKPPKAGVVHGVWELDFNESVQVPGVGATTFAQARDQVGRATVLHRVHPAALAEQRIVKLTTAQVQADCRLAFTEWGLPDAIQTDHASLFQDDDPTPFPTQLNLWWVGLGIEPRRIPRHTPQANGSVERSHRTLHERTLFGQTFQSVSHLQAQVDRDWQELNRDCPSRARGCQGKPPVVAHPELLIPRRPYLPEQEGELFDLQRVQTYLAQFTWVRTVNSHGQLSLGAHRYGLGRAWAGQKVSIRFAPEHQRFVFTALTPQNSAPGKSFVPVTRPARGLNPQAIMGPIEPDHQPVRQLPLPLSLGHPQARLSETAREARV